MSLILGIDPGSRKTGFGIISYTGGKAEYVTSGVIRLPDADLAERLGVIYHSVTELIELHCPTELSIEQVFMAKSAGSALKLGQARGAAIVACVAQSLPVAEYSARQIKQSVVGTGAADKAQVQHMVKARKGLIPSTIGNGGITQFQQEMEFHGAAFRGHQGLHDEQGKVAALKPTPQF